MDPNGFSLKIISPISLTPSPSKLVQSCFNFPPNKNAVSSKVERRSRSFTPMKNDFFLRSPELSPIICDNNLTNSKCVLLPTTACSEPIKPSQNLNKIKILPPSKPIQKRNLRSNNKLKPNESVSSDSNEASFESETLDRSEANGYLNHRLDFSTILCKNGLKKYALFLAQNGVDIGKFVSLTDVDLINLNINQEKDRKKILKIIKDFNST